MKNRYILQLLICGVMMYYAIPRLDVYASGPEGVFAISWVAFALLVLSGSLIGLLYTPKQESQPRKVIQRPVRMNKKKSLRSYS
ncbi:MAG TPA: hypothetical protein VNM69_06140 [Bacillus sp. (in: firmicutes)]|uniref:hypothetical protein n=1 Tax=Bacillus litorisediminis TaxID=2922713 RepID=UPI001FAD1F97|nr:hypothetical protein [Bacillus litorisediminis]HWO75487.1 hypothetical protein [Bacillus sp. (in: firmicutes)]